MPTSWPNLDMDVEDVYNSFFLYALLFDHHERGDIFELQHNAPSQAERLRPALEARNFRMAGTGQEEWNHICDLCCYIYQDDTGCWSEFFFLSELLCKPSDCQFSVHSFKYYGRL
jgi:hypothetical protein